MRHRANDLEMVLQHLAEDGIDSMLEETIEANESEVFLANPPVYTDDAMQELILYL